LYPEKGVSSLLKFLMLLTLSTTHDTFPSLIKWLFTDLALAYVLLLIFGMAYIPQHIDDLILLSNESPRASYLQPAAACDFLIVIGIATISSSLVLTPSFSPP
jgi:hypothetical protein